MGYSNLPLGSGRAHVKVFCSIGWVVRQRKDGSHIVLTKAGVAATLSVPDHREVRRGTLKQLVQDAGLTDAEYARLFREVN